MRPIPASVTLLILLAACSAGPTPTPPPACPSAAPTSAQAPDILDDSDLATVRTNKGAFTIELYGDAAPLATANFVLLARCGFYEGISFHRVIPGFVIQAGDPQTKSNHGDFPGLGTGGPGYHFTIEPLADDLAYDRYVVAMANAGGTDTNGSQFFIDLADLNSLPRQYTIFGKVVSGTEVVDAIGALPTSGDPMNVPLDPAIIDGIEISAVTPSASPSA
jgi:dolichyl-diphosphooligosaccharide--protein glycosyltransferase